MCGCKSAKALSGLNSALPIPGSVVHAVGVGLVVLSTLGGTPGGVTRPGQRQDCAAAYQAYLEELRHKEVEPQRRAALHRWALRVYDACDTGDVNEDIIDLFRGLDRHN